MDAYATLWVGQPVETSLHPVSVQLQVMAGIIVDVLQIV
jgi:hypothetical protein